MSLIKFIKSLLGLKERNKMINLVLFGPPGSGKGTQADKLVEKFGLTHISTGDLFRYEIGNNTTLGQEAQKYMDRGKLVPDEITVAMLENKMNMTPNEKGYILDGFPRTIAQSEALDKILAGRGTAVTHLLALDVNDEEIIRRLLERGKSSGRADDANEEVIKKRIAEYNAKTSPVYDFYAKTGVSKKINGIGSIDDISERLSAALSAVS